VSIAINGEMSSISTIRNLSLLQRSLRKTQTRPAPAAKEGETQAPPEAPPASREQMRSQIGRLTETLRKMESTLEKNQTAAQGLTELRPNLLGMKEQARVAAAAEAVPEEELEAWQQQINDQAATYTERKGQVAWGGQQLLDGSPGSVFNLRELNNLKVDDPDEARKALSRIDATIKELDQSQAQLAASSKSEYESALRSLEVSSQNATAAETLSSNPDSATQQAEYIRQVIGSHGGLAAAAQGNLAGESVFLLLEA
jgi:flagellin-like hook-associated protein FlgL